VIDTDSITHRDGVGWWDAPLPPVEHRCLPWTMGWTFDLHQICRCPCGAIGDGVVLKIYQNTSDQTWNGQWMDRNSRHRPDHGTREVTKRDREIAVKRDLINSTSNVHITPGMRRALTHPRREHPRLRWFKPWPVAMITGK